MEWKGKKERERRKGRRVTREGKEGAEAEIEGQVCCGVTL